MKVAVFGLGYVGSVMTGCLARAGHEVVGVDLQDERVEQVNAGGCPVIEPGVPEAIAQGVAEGRITATTDAAEAVAACELSFVCVGTPSSADGSLEVSRVEAVCRRIGEVLAQRPGLPRHTVVIRSTVMPGTVERCTELTAEAAGCAPGERFTLVVNPEFLREGAGVADFLSPPFTLVGAREADWAEPLRRVYAFVEAPFEVTSPGTAELLKTVCNAWHATKVAFGNEIGRLAGAVGTDPMALMELFVRDERLNLSASYLRPGFAYGGSCLPKDVEALGHLARHHHVELPVLQGVPRSNQLHVDRAVAAIEASGCERVGFLGISFKPDTDDLRSSPLLDLVQACLARGYTVRIFDPNVRVGSLVGSNRDYALSRIRHLAELLVDEPAELVESVDLVVVGHPSAAFAQVCGTLGTEQQVLDLVDGIDSAATPARRIALW
jgi:GDP-mannose 6-dehydrogenase